MKDLIEDRNTYIGSSDASDIIAGNYARLYGIKNGMITPDDLSDNFKVQLGVLTEPFHLEWTLRKLNESGGLPYQASLHQKNGDQHWATFVPEDSYNMPTLGSHPDAVLKASDGTIYPGEVKHTGRFRNADEAADFYMPQIQHHLLCWGADQLLFSVICGTEEPERIWVGASPEYQRHYIERCDTFWAFMKSAMPPPPATHGVKDAKVPASILNTIPFDGMKKRDVTGDNQIAVLLPEFVTTKKAAKRHEEVKKELKGMLRDDESELFCDGFKMARSKSNSILFKEVDEEKWT